MSALRSQAGNDRGMSLATRSVLVTGGAGFIGCELSARLVAEGHRVVVVDVLHPQVHRHKGRPARLPEAAILYPLDVTCGAAWQALLSLEDPDWIVHLAAETGTGQSLTEASRHALVNVVGTARMIDALYACSLMPEHILLASSRAVYGEGLWQAGDIIFAPSPRRHKDLEAQRWDPVAPTGASELVPLPHRAGTTPVGPTSVYGATKFAQEGMLASWTAAMGSSLSILRLQNVYGPGQSPSNAYTGIVTLFVQQALRGDTLEIFEDGQILRDFVFIDDVIEAMTAALHHPPATSQIFDVGSGQSTTIEQLAALTARLLDAPTPRITGRFRDGDVRAASADVTEMQRVLDLLPQTDLEHGLKALIDATAASEDYG